MISLPEEERAWVERRAKEEGVSVDEIVRRAIERLRNESGYEPLSTRELLARTAGIRAGDDGLTLQKHLRGGLGGKPGEDAKAVLLDMPGVGEDADFEGLPDLPRRLDL
jgi:hypothetical protein